MRLAPRMECSATDRKQRVTTNSSARGGYPTRRSDASVDHGCHAPACGSSTLLWLRRCHFTVQVAMFRTEARYLDEISLDSQLIPCLGGRTASFQNWCERENVACGDLSPLRSARHSRGRLRKERRLSSVCLRAVSPGPMSRCRKTCGFALYRCTNRSHGG